MSYNTWLRSQRKVELAVLAERVGFSSFENLKKYELESQLDTFLSSNAGRFESDPELNPYFSARSRNMALAPKTPASVKPETDPDRPTRASKRRTTRLFEEASSSPDQRPRESASNLGLLPRSDDLAVARTRDRNASVGDMIITQVSRANVAVDNLYRESGVAQAMQWLRAAFSSVMSILLSVALAEWFQVLRQVVPILYYFFKTETMGLNKVPIPFPDPRCLGDSSFWAPVRLQALTSIILPLFFGYFFNLTAGRHHHSSSGRGRKPSSSPDYTFDPLVFSISKAAVSYLVYAEGMGLGLFSPETIGVLDGSFYGGWKAVLAGCTVTSLMSFYDAILHR